MMAATIEGDCMLYRNTDIHQVFEAWLGELRIAPKQFSENPDSTCPSGTWSFWFDLPVKLPLADCIVAANRPDDAVECVMSFSKKDSYDLVFYEITEVVCSSKVAIDSIYSDEDVDADGLFWDYAVDILDVQGDDWTEYQKLCEEFAEWFNSVRRPIDDDFAYPQWLAREVERCSTQQYC